MKSLSTGYRQKLKLQLIQAQIRQKVFAFLLSVTTVLTVVFLLSGCARQQTVSNINGGLSVLPPAALAAWGTADQFRSQGEGNSFRVVTGSSLGAEQALELAAGGSGQLEYFQDITAEAGMTAVWRVQFLSTQGTGQLKISALDSEGRELAVAGWVVTGKQPLQDAHNKWVLRPFNGNYCGEWLTEQYSAAQMLAGLLSAADAAKVKTYRLSVIAGQGQHVLVTQFYWLTDHSNLVKVKSLRREYVANVGEQLQLETEVENFSPYQLRDIAVAVQEPAGYGLEVNSAKQMIPLLQPGEKKRLSWQLTARRSHLINCGQPWLLPMTIDQVAIPAPVQIAVYDPRPGKVFYVMTEDLEAIDGAGYTVAWGNQDGWLSPEELQVQMIDKPEKLNAIAAQYGAYWTHYTAWPLVKAAEWAAARSTTGQWQSVATAIGDAVKKGAAAGHEYGIHLHTDYDPLLPGNVLSYNAAVDGLWANHLRHGWAHSLPQEGRPDDLTSRTGILFTYQRQMDELSANSPLGQLLTARAGSFDFGDNPASELMSTRACQKTGLWGSSDADGNAGRVTAADYGREIYLARADNINLPAEEPAVAGIVEFRATPLQYISYDQDSAAAMNAKADLGMQSFTGSGSVQAGVHAIIGFTHAMFMLGEGGWQSTAGGQFKALDEHLAYLKTRYGDNGLLQFSTATGLVREYLDYYALQPVVVYEQRSSDSYGVAEYPLTILGRDIPVDQAHPQRLSVKYPLYLRDNAYWVAVYKNGSQIYSTWDLPTTANDIIFTADEKSAVYTLRVYHNQYLFRLLHWLQKQRKWLLPG